MNDPFEGLGDALWVIRRKRGWTQKIWAAKCGLDPASISRYEKGTIRPNLENLTILLNSADCSLKELDDALHVARGEPMPSTLRKLRKEQKPSHQPFTDAQLLDAVMRAIQARLPS